MKKAILVASTICFVISVLVSGCASTGAATGLTTVLVVGGVAVSAGTAGVGYWLFIPKKPSEKAFSQPSPNFRPKETYDVSYDKMWETVKKVLTSERIGTTSLTKDEGRIVTEDIQVEGKPNIFGYGYSVFYRYTIDMEKISEKTTKLKVMCSNPEQSALGISFQRLKNTYVIRKNLEYWLYEKIENSL